MYVDSHCHIGFPGYGGALKPTLDRCREAGVGRLVCVGIDADTSVRAAELARLTPGIWASVGLHPHLAEQLSPKLLEDFERSCAQEKVVAVGETGLDTFKNRAPLAAQERSFRAHLELACRVGLPVVIHCRDAHARCRELLAQTPPPAGVIHCFTGNAEEAAAYRELGMLLSFSGIVTYKNAKDLREAVRQAPGGSFLLETDSPFLTPRPPGGRTNQPSYLPYTAQCVARLRGEDLGALARETSAVAEAFFGLNEQRL